ARCDELGFAVLWPTTGAVEPLLESLLRAPDLAAWTATADDQLAPPTDDWPFFFQASRLGRVSGGDYLAGGLQLLMVLLVASAGLALLLLLLGRHAAAPDRGLATATAAFALGVGFMALEIGLLQRLLLLLGHPTWSLALVL